MSALQLILKGLTMWAQKGTKTIVSDLVDLLWLALLIIKVLRQDITKHLHPISTSTFVTRYSQSEYGLRFLVYM